MARSIHKQWRNARGGRWTARIQWYEAGRWTRGGDGETFGEDIRLALEDSDMIINIYPTTEAQAQAIWDTFKLRCPKPAKPYEKAPEALGVAKQIHREFLNLNDESKEARDGAGD